jgi:polysaccharide biosynthesis/export protein
MSGHCDSADNLSERARRRCQNDWRTAALLFVFVSLVGCKSAEFTARNLPASLQASATRSTSAVNIEQMAGDGVGASEIGPGDLISVVVNSGTVDDKMTPIPARVGEDGKVMVPLIGGVSVAGVEPVMAEQRIASAAIERGIYRQPYVTITITQRAVNHITVLGGVSRPGVVELPRGASDLASAIAAAGGLSNDAGTQVEILHHGNPQVAVNTPATPNANAPNATSSTGVKLAAYSELTKPTTSPIFPPPATDASQPGTTTMRVDLTQIGSVSPQARRLEDRDVVMVQPRERRLIHVTGLVQKPNEFELPHDQDLRVLDAIALAGGTTSLVADKVFVIRKMPNMTEPAVIKVSIARAKRDGNENLRLAEGDMVSVENTPATVAVDTISKFFRVALGVSGSLAAF